MKLLGEYRARQVETALGETEETGNLFVEMLFEVVSGPAAMQRCRFRGYLNSDANAVRTIEAMRTAGWKGAEFGDWRFAPVEVVIVVLEEPGQSADGSKRMFSRVAFVRPVSKLAIKRPVSPDRVGELSARFAGLLVKPPSSVVDPNTGEIRNGIAAEPEPDFIERECG